MGREKKPAAPRSAAAPPTLAFASPADWERWLSEHHETVDGIWLKFAKKNTGVASVVYAEALEIALCHGWIDGQVKRLDETYYLQRFTPRRARSKWSKINCGKVEALIAAGKMKPAGLRQIEAAKADGRWAAAYDSPRTADVPPDLAAEFRKHKQAAATFEKWTRQNRYAVLYQIQDAKRPETRRRRIDKVIAMLLEGKAPHM